MSPLLAQSGHAHHFRQCPLLGVKRTLVARAEMSVMTQSGHRRPNLLGFENWRRA